MPTVLSRIALVLSSLAWLPAYAGAQAPATKPRAAPSAPKPAAPRETAEKRFGALVEMRLDQPTRGSGRTCS